MKELCANCGKDIFRYSSGLYSHVGGREDCKLIATPLKMDTLPNGVVTTISPKAIVDTPFGTVTIRPKTIKITNKEDKLKERERTVSYDFSKGGIIWSNQWDAIGAIDQTSVSNTIPLCGHFAIKMNNNTDGTYTWNTTWMK